MMGVRAKLEDRNGVGQGRPVETATPDADCGKAKRCAAFPQSAWESAKDADSHRCLEKASQRTLGFSTVPTGPAAVHITTRIRQGTGNPLDVCCDDCWPRIKARD